MILLFKKLLNIIIKIHTGLTPERWFKFSLCEQLANVGCDVSRAINGKNDNDHEFSEQSFYRAATEKGR